MLATNTMTLFKIVQFQLMWLFACAWSQIKELSVNTQFSECIVAATQRNKNLLYHFDCQCQGWDPLLWKMLQEVNCSFGISCLPNAASWKESAFWSSVEGRGLHVEGSKKKKK